MVREVLATIVVALGISGCDWSPAFSSDPAFWEPPASTEPSIDAAAAVDGGAQEALSCDEVPPYDASLVTSKAGGSSHGAGQPCLEGCHESGGSARLTFAAGGTAYRSQTSREVARGGEVHGIGGTTLAVDGCGNFYATPGALKAGPQATQPFVQNPTFRRMDKPLFRQAGAGSCNQSGCHDFGGKLRWGVYF
jgi:hypothetical protein